MNNEYVEFKKERDLGTIITDTFKFLRLEWKPFFTTVFKIAIIPILFAIVGVLYYTYETSNMFAAIDFENPNSVSDNPFSGGGIVLAAIIMMVSFVIAYIMINVASMYYLKSYVDNKGQVSYDEISQNVKENVWSFIGLGILIGIMVGVGMLFCFIPGVYLGVVLSLATSIYVFKGKDVMETINYSFEFIKDNWWNTFGVLFVMGLLVAVLGYVFSIPAIIYMFARGFVGAINEDPSFMQSIFSDPFYLFFTIVSYVGRFLFYAVSLVSTVLIFFDINEQKYASGTIDKIESLGK